MFVTGQSRGGSRHGGGCVRHRNRGKRKGEMEGDGGWGGVESEPGGDFVYSKYKHK